MTPLELARKTLVLISDEKAWTKGRYAEDNRGLGITVDNDTACKFCSMGAMFRELWESEAGPWEMYYRLPEVITVKRAFERVTRRSIIGYNDNEYTTHNDIVRAWKMLSPI